MARKNNILICVLILLFFSCEKQRFLNVPFTETKFVINGLFSQNEPCRLEISKSQYLNDTSRAQNISTASVSLFENDVFIEKLSYSSPEPGKTLGTYKSVFTNFVSTRKYSINVETDSGEIITASDIIPNGVATIKSFSGPTVSDSLTTVLNFDLLLEQNDTKEKYFHVFLQNRWVKYSSIPGDSNLLFTPWFDKQIFTEQNPTGFITTTSEPFGLTVGNSLQGLMLDNQNFNELTKSISFLANSTNQQQVNVYLESRVIVRSVSANYFKYYFSSSQYDRTKGTPLTEPVIIHNNIENGLGNFAGYNSTDTSAIIRTYY